MSMKALNVGLPNYEVDIIRFFESNLSPEAIASLRGNSNIVNKIRVIDFKTTVDLIIKNNIKDINKIPSLTKEEIHEKWKAGEKFYKSFNEPVIGELNFADICWEVYDNYHYRHFIYLENNEPFFCITLSRNSKEGDPKDNIFNDGKIFHPIMVIISVDKNCNIITKYYFNENNKNEIDVGLFRGLEEYAKRG